MLDYEISLINNRSILLHKRITITRAFFSTIEQPNYSLWLQAKVNLHSRNNNK